MKKKILIFITLISVISSLQVTSCPPGTYQSLLNNCVTCPGGYYCPNITEEPSEKVSTFSEATFAKKSEIFLANHPIICPEGFFCAPGAGFPIQCMVGFCCPIGSSSSKPCYFI